MSIIAVKKYEDRVVIGADSYVGFSSETQLKDPSGKIFQHEGLTVATCGWDKDNFFLKSFIRRTISSPFDLSSEYDVQDFMSRFLAWAESKNPGYKFESQMLLVCKSKVFFVRDTLYIEEVKEYRASGNDSAENIAQVALYFDKTVEEALEVACQFSIYCEKPLTIFEIKTS
jgi:ATP-dependent protease HslVU (ClpYQ) peptidase subunit